MNAYTKLTLKELMSRKEQMLEAKKKPKRTVLFVKSLNATITIEQPDRMLVSECTEMENGRGDVYMVYQCVVEPSLKSQELQQAFECVDPLDIVDKVFDPGEIPSIALKCMDLAGYNNENVKEATVEETKNL